MTAMYPPKISAAVQSFLDEPHGLFIDGDWVQAQSGKVFDTFDPATGQRIASVAEADTWDLDRAVDAARRAFEGPGRGSRRVSAAGCWTAWPI